MGSVPSTHSAAPIVRRPAPRESTRHAALIQWALISVLLVDAAIHLALTPEHLAESRALGVGFLVSGLLQAVLAGARVRGMSSLVGGAVIGLSVVLLAAYALNVTIGLPLPYMGQAAMMADEAPGGPEDVTPIGVVSKLLEVAAVALAFASRAPQRADRKAVGVLAVESATRAPVTNSAYATH